MVRNEMIYNQCILYNEVVLTDKEKEYLRAVLTPFKSEKIFVTRRCVKGYEKDLWYIDIDIGDNGSFMTPNADKPIYAGMEVDRKYTAQELELWTEE